ncbi:helix-turn-helix domain-containing protein [Streptomyces caeruleatus]|uniref:helix-turn-helix domain-containing protein n=1 Tax=Streptomyces caeruleatus TaxID=661399 RepID=UPI000AF7135B
MNDHPDPPERLDALAGRLAALDPDAGAAVRAIAYFDRLAEARAGLEALVRGAAVLTGYPARLIDTARRVHVRVESDGKRHDTDSPPDSSWLCRELAPDTSAALWLERPGPPSVVDAVILERASGILRQILDRTRGRAPLSASDDRHCWRRCSTPRPGQRLVCMRHAVSLSVSVSVSVSPMATRPYAYAPWPCWATPPNPARAPRRAAETGGSTCRTGRNRAGCPCARPVAVLGRSPGPQSWAAARTALRFTAEGTADDPGERVMYANDLGDIVLLADLVRSGTGPPPDARALAAAAKLNIHHSTLETRLAHAEGLLGWPVHTLTGHLRLQLALLTRRLARGEDRPLQP